MKPMLIALNLTLVITPCAQAREVPQPSKLGSMIKSKKKFMLSCPAKMVLGKPVTRIPIGSGWLMESKPKKAPLKNLTINQGNRMRCLYWGANFRYIYISRPFPRGYQCRVVQRLRKFECKPK